MKNGEDGVRGAVNGFAEAWNRHDMNAFGALFAADADFVNVGGRWWRGRQEIQTNHAYSHGAIPKSSHPTGIPAHYGIFKMSTHHFDRIDVRFVRADVAVAHATWTNIGDERATEPRHGMMTLIVTRDRNRWLISAAQNTEINRTVK